MHKKIVFFLILIFLSCETLTRKDNDVNKQENKDLSFEFLDCNYFINFEKSTDYKNNFRKLNYQLVFSFKNKNNDFLISYTIFSDDDKILAGGEAIRPSIDFNDKNHYFIKDSFDDFFCYNKIKYNLTVNINSDIKFYSGQFTDNSVPYLDAFEIGPIITKSINGRSNVVVNIRVIIKNSDDISWIRIIPPKEDSYWDIPFSRESGDIVATGMIWEKNKSFIENGEYLLQVNLDKYGLIQKKFVITDIYNNTDGENYGLPIPVLLSENINLLKFDMTSMDKIEYMEIVFSVEVGGMLQKIGSVIFQNPVSSIKKKELKDKILDIFGKPLNLKSNTEYSYEVYLYSKEYNGIKYLSISPVYKIKFKKYKFFNF